jgi:hypothetical protein
MAEHAYLLEHEILKILYTKVSFSITGEGKLSGKTMPVYKRSYEYSSLHFGTLVDILNNPEKYTPEKTKSNNIHHLKELIVHKEDVEPNNMKYGWIEVNDALEVLAINGHIKEGSVEINIFSDNMKREIFLTGKGAIDYRTGFYLKELDKELSAKRGYEIQKRDLWLKKYWILVEISKYVIGGIIGASIALAVAEIRKSPEQKLEKSDTPKEDAVSSYTERNTSSILLPAEATSQPCALRGPGVH